MEVVDVSAQFSRRRRTPASIEIVVHPPTGRERWHRPDDQRPRRDLAGRADGPLATVRRAEVHDLVGDLRRHRAHLARMPPARKHLEIEKAGVVDREKQSSDTTRLHYLNVD